MAKLKYQDRLDRVIDYIYDHLDEDIDLQHLADIACLSPYHWHRVYRGIKGESIKQTVKRLRLHRAAGQLMNTSMPITEIAARSGYSAVSAFTRAFAEVYQMPPAKYRERGIAQTNQHVTNGENDMYDVRIIEVPIRVLVGLFHEGSYHEIGKAFERLAIYAAQHGIDGSNSRMNGIYFDDPDIVPTNQLNSFAGWVEPSPTEVEPPFERVEFNGGRFAVLSFTGPYSELNRAYRWFYGPWLEQADVDLRDVPCMEEYLNDPRSVPPHQLRTDIYLPIQ
jgi:AraC family transcriptional regulator